MNSARCEPLLPVSTGGWDARSRQGFTLLELIIVITLLSILMAIAVPSFTGLQDEKIAREPMNTLALMAKETRLRAMEEKRPYQIAFTSTGFTATRYFSPYLQVAELQEFMAKVDHQAALQAAATEQGIVLPPTQSANASTAGSQADASPAYREWTKRYLLPEGVTYSVKNWYEATPTEITGDTVRLWVFQPSGITEPYTVHLRRQSASFEASFSSLTADVVSEKSDTP